jgi:8-oxo-dGTP pyrophosphatase MutT (NUDIX family)
VPGRAHQLLRAFVIYYRLAWWGLARPRIGESHPLTVTQAVILREHSGVREVLLSVRSDLRGWELPGGTPERDEDLAGALKREVREETGLRVDVGRHVGDYVRSGFRPHTARVHLCRVIGGTLRPSRETPVVRWFACGALPDTLFPWYHAPLMDALDKAVGGDAPPLRSEEHQGIAAIWAGLRIDLRMRLSGDRAGLP